jgi:DNA invertase Pin-like site-specific DNA recombinase
VKLVAYVRVSTEKQLRTGYGRADQERQVRAWCKSHGHKLARIIFDDAKSGTLDAGERPGLLDVLRTIKDREAEGVVMRDLDRIARTLTVQEAVLAQVWHLGGHVFVVTDSDEIPQDDPDDPMRTAMRQMAGVFAQLERAMTVKRLRNGRAEKATQGGYAYGGPPFGWRAEGKELVPDVREQAILLNMHDRRKEGMSYGEIASLLNEAGSLPRRGRWHPQTVSRALTRRVEHNQHYNVDLVQP